MVLTLLTNEGGIFVFMEIDIQICRVNFYRQFTKKCWVDVSILHKFPLGASLSLELVTNATPVVLAIKHVCDAFLNPSISASTLLTLLFIFLLNKGSDTRITYT